MRLLSGFLRSNFDSKFIWSIGGLDLCGTIENDFQRDNIYITQLIDCGFSLEKASTYTDF